MQVEIGSDNLLKVTGLKNQATAGGFENAATVQATLRNPGDDSTVAGQTWPLTLTYVAASDGNYEGVLEDALILIQSRAYYVEVVADAGAGKKRTWRLPVTAVYAAH